MPVRRLRIREAGVAPELPGTAARQVLQQPEQLALDQTAGAEKSQEAIDAIPLSAPRPAAQRVHDQGLANPSG